MGPGGQEHRRTQRCVHMDADSSKRVCAGCGEAMPAAEGWHKCSKCKAPVHSHITCSKVHSDPCDEESHICDSCFVGLQKSFFILDSESVKLCSSSVLPHEISAQNCAGFEAKQKSKSSWTHSNPGTWKRCRFLKWKTDGLPLAHGSGKV